ncbi:hypothetical protein HYFRA_00013275 [Hymenoscyphus fraxineus]|uniref:Heterokaryon incompatibility domain-containing protein n=1 Tax=Hymenoscyphus fraxineus TaxID=746836 RepID=A0A9N9PNT2_9HELO|nr:hypothetical protein HYFRA_00013275 [Hymenoscyphus fraxineus]
MAELVEDPSSNESWEFYDALTRQSVFVHKTPLSEISAGPGRICALCIKGFQAYRDVCTFKVRYQFSTKFADAGCNLCKMIIDHFRLSDQQVQLEMELHFYEFRISICCPVKSKVDLRIKSIETVSASDVNLASLLIVSQEPSTIKRIVGMREEESIGLIRRSTLDQLRSWMSRCLQDDGICASNHLSLQLTKQLPTRLLEIGKDGDCISVRVIETASLSPETEYVTLSHCWGTKRHITLTLATYENFVEDVPWKMLPKTFTDAIELTKLLHYKYIWIDSLCIIQDSNPDWVKEASMMAQVYSFCRLNISVDTATDDDGGLFQQSYGNFCVTDFELDGKHHNFVWHKDDMWQENIEDSALGRRGWVVQERILSPRILHFAKDQVYWECCQQSFAETLPTFSRGDYRHEPLRKSLPETELEKYHVWSETVKKLIAISALARRTCASLKLSPKDYLAGLWRPELNHELLWATPSNIYDREEEMIPSCQVWDSDQVGAPSWSWASCNFQVVLPVRDIDPPNELVNCLVVLEAETFFGNDPFGSLSGGRLLVQAPLHHIAHSKKPAGTIPEEPFFPGYGKPSPIRIRWDHDWESIWDEKGYLKPKSLYCMCIQAGTGSVYGLVLQPTGQGIGQFRRLGAFTLDMDTESEVERFLKECRNSAVIPDDMFKAHDPEKGFTIEIV